MKNIVTMTETEFENHSNEHDGICSECGEITFGGCEPDAEKYACDSCGSYSVYGVEQAIIIGLIGINYNEGEKNEK